MPSFLRSFSAPTIASASGLLARAKQADLREDAADRAREVAAVLHEHRRGVDRGRGIGLAGAQRLEGLGEVVEGHHVDRLQALVGRHLGHFARAPLLDTAQLDGDALAGEIVDGLQPQRIALGGEEEMAACS